MNTVVNFELAKLLKEKGFEQKDCKGYYLKNGLLTTMPFTDYTNGFTVAAAPTIADVVMWLYKKHGIWINLKHLPFNQKFGFSITGKYDLKNYGILLSYDFKHYDSPEEAYEAAIEYCLKNLI